jgi:tetratricopeptide (TPR) repeat protein
MLAFWQGDFDRAEYYAGQSERVFREEGAMERLALQLTDHTTVFLSQGNALQAAEMGRSVLDIYRQHPSPRGEQETLHYLGVAYLHLGKDEEALDCLGRCIFIATKLGDHTTLCWGHLHMGLVYDSLHDDEAAWGHAFSCVRAARTADSNYMLALANAFLAHAEHRLRRPERAAIACKEARERAQDFDWRMRTPVKGLVTVALAECHAKEKMWKESNQEFKQALEEFHGSTFGLIYEAIAQVWFADSLESQGLAEEMRRHVKAAMEIYRRLSNQTILAQLEARLG